MTCWPRASTSRCISRAMGHRARISPTTTRRAGPTASSGSWRTFRASGRALGTRPDAVHPSVSRLRWLYPGLGGAGERLASDERHGFSFAARPSGLQRRCSSISRPGHLGVERGNERLRHAGRAAGGWGLLRRADSVWTAGAVSGTRQRLELGPDLADFQAAVVLGATCGHRTSRLMMTPAPCRPASDPARPDDAGLP